jgi:hypothetical protein
MPEWTVLAALDATGVGEQLGMLFDTEAERRREVMRAHAGHVARRIVAPTAHRTADQCTTNP